MTDAIIQPVKTHVKFDGTRGPVLVHRDDIARISQSLVLASDDNQTRQGIILLAIALGCDIETEK